MEKKADKKPLTEKQKAFCEYYIASTNATEAAKKAGYSEKTAKSVGSENLTKPDIKAYIDERLKEMQDNRIADAEEVLTYLSRVMRGVEKDQFDLEPTLTDRTKAAELLGKRYALFVDKKEVSGKIEGVTIIDDIPKDDRS